MHIGGFSSNCFDNTSKYFLLSVHEVLQNSTNLIGTPLIIWELHLSGLSDGSKVRGVCWKYFSCIKEVTNTSPDRKPTGMKQILLELGI